jgi:hypothetical protein
MPPPEQPRNPANGQFVSTSETPPAESERPTRNYFREEKNGFDIDIPSSTITLPEPDAPPQTPRPQREERPAEQPPEQRTTETAEEPDPVKKAATRALAEMLGWKEPPPDKPLTAKGEKWLTPEEWVEKFSPKKTRERLEALEADVDRRVSERVGREIASVKGLIDKAIAHQRAKLDHEYKEWIAQAPNPQESRRRQGLRDKELETFDQQTAPQMRREAGQPGQQQTPEIPAEYATAFRDFAARNRAWFDPSGRAGNRAMTRTAQSIVAEVARDPRFAGDPVAEFVEIERRVKEEFAGHTLFKPAGDPPPQDGGNGHANGGGKPPDIQGGGRRGGGGGAGRGWAALSDAQKQMFEKVHVPFGAFKNDDKGREAYAAKIHADTGKKRGFDIS